MLNSLFSLKKITKFTLLFLLFAGVSFAQKATNTQLASDKLQINTITTAVPFLLIGPDSKAGGMGETGVATEADCNSMHWNPAKYAFIEKQSGFSLSYIPWLRQLVDDINLSYLSGYYKVGKDQTLAASLRYFSLGNIMFTDNNGTNIREFRPNEFGLDVAYSRKLSERVSGGLALRYVYSNLTGGINVAGANTKAGQSVAADISFLYQNTDLEINGNKSRLAFGANLSNIGSKMSYTTTLRRDFIPVNMRVGGSFRLNLDQYNALAIHLDFNKLLVPTPPVYEVDASGKVVTNPDGTPKIAAGENPNRSLAAGVFGSFSDAPGGTREELREVMTNVGLEYCYDNLFSFRTGYFHENVTKGNRQVFTVGFGIRYSSFNFDASYLIPTNRQNSPLNNTFRFTLGFDFGDSKKRSKD